MAWTMQSIPVRVLVRRSASGKLNVATWPRAGPVLVTSLALGGCMNTYHREYHPESSYKVVENVIYAQNVVALPPVPVESGPAPIDVEMAAPYLKLWNRSDAKGRPVTPAQGAHPPHGSVSSPGGLVIYGDVYGDVFLGR
jgi:hypothetical protein